MSVTYIYMGPDVPIGNWMPVTTLDDNENCGHLRSEIDLPGTVYAHIDGGDKSLFTELAKGCN